MGIQFRGVSVGKMGECPHQMEEESGAVCGELGVPGGASALAPALGSWVDGGCALFTPPGVGGSVLWV